MLLTELNPDFQRALHKELLAGEELLWWAQPDVDAIARSLLPYSIIWLSGLFLMSVGMLLDTPDETRDLLIGLIFILTIVAVGGVLELVFVPRRAARTVYVVTSRRVFSLCVTKKFNAQSEQPDEKRILREDPSSALRFYLANLPSQILLFLAASDVIHVLSHRLDIFLATGFGLVIVGWTRPWFYEMRWPLAKFREDPRLLYAIDDMFIAMEWLPRDQVRQIKLRRLGRELFNGFLISDKAGCVRFRAIAGENKADMLAACLSAQTGKEARS